MTQATPSIPTAERPTPPPPTLAPAVESEYNRTGVDFRAPMPWPKVKGPVIDFHCHLFAARHAKPWFEAARGVYQQGVRLQSIEDATVVRVRDGKLLVTDGPFTESREWIAGFAILDAPDLDTAIELAARNPMAFEGRIELRPIHSMGGPDD